VLERLRVSSPDLALGASGTGASPLEYRIRRIIRAHTGERTRDYAPSSLPGILALGLTLACVAIYSSPARGSAPVVSAPVEYPESARVEGIQGTVPVEVNIDDLGRVRDARAMGGPRELRQWAVESAAALRFAPEEAAASGRERVNVAFQLVPATENAPAAAPAVAPAPVHTAEAPARAALSWIDEGESDIGVGAAKEKDPAKKLELLKQWEQQYPNSEFRNQRTFMTASALMEVLLAANGSADAAVLDAGRKAGLQLVEHFTEYFGESVKPSSTTSDLWVKARRASELQVHTVLAYIAQARKNDETVEAELRKALAVDPEQALTSYQLGATILREMATNNELTRYSEAIYDIARALAITGPNALSPEARAAAENALKESYGSYHGSTDGLEELMRLVGSSVLPPPGFHIVSVGEGNETRQMAQMHAAWAAAHPELDLWETTKTALLEHGDVYFAKLHDDAAPAFRMIQATVVAQPSANRLIVNVDNIAAGDAILKFDGDNVGAVRPGTRIQFTGLVDSYTPDPYVLTFIIRNPKVDIVGLDTASPKQKGIWARVVKGLSRFVHRLG
jgi:tetratricopeptide (TPR) repeat protein